MRSYEASRNLFSFLVFLAWCAIFLGVAMALVGGSLATQARSFGSGPHLDIAAIMAALPGFGVSFFGFIALAMAQNGRATVDTAELTQQMLKVARDQLEVSKQALKKDGLAPTGFPAVAAPHNSPSGNGEGYDAKPKPGIASPSQGSLQNGTNANDPRVAIGVIDGTLTYKDKEISVKNGKFFVGPKVFKTVYDAQLHIDFVAREALNASSGPQSV